jgi:signal transduction histidine kinase
MLRCAVVSWWKARWVAFQQSYDAREAAALSSPGVIVIGVGLTCLGLLLVGTVPYLAAASQMRLPLLPVCIGLLGGVATYTAYRHHATGPIGTACMLIDTSLYTGAFALTALLSRGTFSLAFAGALALFQITFPASTYGLSLLITLAMCGPPLLLLAAIGAPPAVWVMFWVGSTLALTTSYRTAQRRNLALQNERLRSAVGEASRAADESLDNAITASLLDVGHFLHELRNLQALQRMNLEYIAEESKLDEPCSAALRDVLAAREAEEKLIARALDDIRRRSRTSARTFELQPVVQTVLEDNRLVLTTTAILEAPGSEVSGNPEHLQLVLQNLLRNAAQAGASKVTLRVFHEQPGYVCLELSDNGPGIPESALDTLFQPFGTSGRSDGTGLGLYLVRRYVELMGGRVLADCPAGGGARFRLTFPSHEPTASPAPPPAVATSSTQDQLH